MKDLINYGWRPFFEGEHAKDTVPARVIEVHRQKFKVACEFGEVSAVIKGTLMKNIKSSGDIPVVGDFVYLQYNPSGDSLISKVCSRKSKFSRMDFSGHKVGYVKTVHEQILAANFDYAFILVSLNHDFNLNRIERYLSIALESGGEPVIVLTKADLNPDHQVLKSELEREFPVAKVYAISAVTGFGLDALNAFLSGGKTIVFLGSSGVGKSTLVNAMAHAELMAVGDIREDDSRGRHTTSHRQLFMLDSGVMVIDTPGIRELGIWDSEDGIKELHSEIEELISQCRFTNCSHTTEPGCKIIEALQNQTLSIEKWNRFNTLTQENAWGMGKAAYTKREKLAQKIKEK